MRIVTITVIILIATDKNNNHNNYNTTTNKSVCRRQFHERKKKINKNKNLFQLKKITKYIDLTFFYFSLNVSFIKELSKIIVID